MYRSLFLGRVCAGVACALLLVGVAPTASAVNMVVNGSFETYTGPGPGAGEGAVPMSSGGLTAWSNSNLGESLVFPSWHANGVLYTCCGGVGVAGWPTFPATSPDGGNFLFSDGNYLNSPITQTITGLSPGTTYLLTFWQSLVQDVQPFPSSTYFITVPGPVTGGWQVTLGSNTQVAPTMFGDGSIPTFSAWAQQSMFFTPTSATEVLTFLSFGTGDPPLVGLDGISLEEYDHGVPEPALLWAVGAGAALAARMFGSRRRRA